MPSITSATHGHSLSTSCESDGSRNGLHDLAANNGNIKSEGELNLSCRSSEGIPFKLKMQGAGVSRPILSVIRLTESGKDVIFKKNGGIIRDTQTGVTTTFRRKHGICHRSVGQHRT